MTRHYILGFALVTCVAAQTPTQVDWNTQIKNRGSYPVTQNTAGTNGGYIVMSPVTYSPYDGSTCLDKWGNQVQQPLPSPGQPPFGPNDLVLWNSLSPSLPFSSPQAGLILGAVQDVVITGVPSTGPGPCGNPLPVNQLYGVNTNGYFFGRAGLATDSPLYNSIQSLQGGITANSITMGVLYPIGTVTTTGVLSSVAYLGGHVDTGHSVGPPTCTGGYPCAASDHLISGSTNPLSAGEGLVAGMIYYDDNLHCEQVYSGTAWGCIGTGGGGGGGGDPNFHSVTAATVFNSAADVNGGNAFQTSAGSLHITGAGDAFFQSDNVTNAFNSLADVTFSGNVSTLGTAVTWLFGTHFTASMAGGYITINKLLYQVAGFIDNSHLTLASSAGAQATAPYQFGNAFQTSTGTMQLTGSGFLLGQAFISHGAFNSQADVNGGNAFQTSGGTMTITGAGVGNFQSINLTNGWTSGGGTNLNSAGILTVNGCVGCGGGGSGSPGGPGGSIQFNGSPGFSGDPNLIWNGATHTLQVTGTAGQGVTAPVFSASAGRTTQTNVEFQGTNFSVLGNGTVQFNGPLNFGGLGTAPAISATGNATLYYNTVNNDFEASYSTTPYTGFKSPVFNCTATGGSNCMQSAAGTFNITGAGNAAFQSLALTNGWTAGGGASLSSGGVLTVTGCSGCGGGGSGVASFNGRVGAVTLTKNDVTSVTQALAPTDSPQFVNLTLTGSIAVGGLINGVTYQNQNGTFTVSSGGGLATQSIGVGSGSPLTISNSGTIITTGAATIGTTFNVGSHGGSTASSGGGGAISNASSNVALFTYDTGGVCGIGSGEPSPGIACSSDERLKKNISPLTSSLSDVMNLRPVSYDWKTNGSHGIGFIAQEVQKVLPGLVTEQDGYLMLSADGMIPYLVRAIQEQQVEINDLKAGRSLSFTVAQNTKRNR